MALILQTGKTYNPNLNGVDMTNGDYYGVIDHISYDKASRHCFFSVDVYASAEYRAEENSAAVSRFNLNYNGDSFDETIGNDGITIPQAYVMALADAQLVDWESDEA